MRVVYIHSSAELYGSDRSLLNICGQMVNRKGCTIAVLLPSNGPLKPALEKLGVEVHVTRLAIARRTRPTETARGLLNAWRVNRILRRFDIVHANTVAVLNPLLVTKVQVVYHVRETLQETRLERFLAKLVARRSSCVITPSADTASRFRKAAGVEGKVRVIPNALPDVVKSTNNTLQEVESRRLRIGCVGRFNSWKGQELLARAFLELAQVRPNVDLVLAGGPTPGDPTQFEQVKLILSQLSDRVSILGEVARGESVMEQCDIAVVPSIKPEPFGLVVLEGLRAGCAVIASDSGGPAEIISNNKDGLLFEMGNLSDLVTSLKRLIDDGQLRQRLQAAGRIRARDYTPQATVNAIVDVYEKL